MLRPHFPTPLTALLLVLAAWFVSMLGVTLLIGPFSSGGTPTLDPGFAGIAQALGFGLVATLAARRVPGPQAERLGLTPLAWRYLPLIAMGAPLAIVASELDNLLAIPFPAADTEAITSAFARIREADGRIGAEGECLLFAGETIIHPP